MNQNEAKENEVIVAETTTLAHGLVRVIFMCQCSLVPSIARLVVMPPKKKSKIDSELSKGNGTDQVSGGKETTPSTVSSKGYWLMKSEPESRLENGVDVKFSIDDLKKEPEQTACWDGVRNYQARNFMRDKMKKGDLAFFYHSNCKEPGVAGIVEIVKQGYVDHTQFDKKDPHYDPKSSKKDPKWFMVDVRYVRHLNRFVPLTELKKLHLMHKDNNGPLCKLSLFTTARLSVQQISEEEFNYIVNLENQESST